MTSNLQKGSGLATSLFKDRPTKGSSIHWSQEQLHVDRLNCCLDYKIHSYYGHITHQFNKPNSSPVTNYPEPSVGVRWSTIGNFQNEQRHVVEFSTSADRETKSASTTLQLNCVQPLIWHLQTKLFKLLNRVLSHGHHLLSTIKTRIWGTDGKPRQMVPQHGPILFTNMCEKLAHWAEVYISYSDIQ